MIGAKIEMLIVSHYCLQDGSLNHGDFIYLHGIDNHICLLDQMRKTALLLVLIVFAGYLASESHAQLQSSQLPSSQLQSPRAFLGYELGDRFTPHHRVIDYFEHVAANSERVKIEQYGETYEGRPLITAYIASAENMGRLDEIRQNNLRRIEMEEGDATDASAAIVWLGYNVHGNESVSMEASMKTLYTLADPSNAEAAGWLESTVIVIDPCLNPDGRDRYANWYNQTVGRFPNVKPEAREHSEPWPGGRGNHYMFDLNRDWAWMSQQELQARVPHYNKWMPHVHVDFHEQGVNSPYYFAPAAEPYHEVITPWQRAFQKTIGQNHAHYFDKEGWLYFTGQVFDLLYPGYGDTWPTFNGAIGMTYEQAGSGRAGLGIITAESDTLTLADRIAHHHTTGLSTVEVTARHSEQVIDEFVKYHNQAAGNSKYPLYVIKGQRTDAFRALQAHLEAQGIQFVVAAESASATGYRYETGASARFNIAEGDMLVYADQPRSRLLEVLFDPSPALPDSLTYDVTSWALPYVYGLDAYAATGVPRWRVEPQKMPVSTAKIDIAPVGKPYAYIVEWSGFEDARFLAALFEKDIKLRYTGKPFEMNGKTWRAGTLLITRTGNQHMGEGFDVFVRQTAETFNRQLVAVATGLVDEGPDFGSEDVNYLKRPRIASLIGAPTRSYASGEVWHFFDQQLGYPVTLMQAEGFDVETLNDYDVLILPSGSYGSLLSSNMLKDLQEWIRPGGRLIAMERAASFLAGKDGFDLKEKSDGQAADSVDHASRRYEDRERESISDDVPGAIYRVNLDNSHPIAYGYPDVYYTMKRSDDIYAYFEQDNNWNVGVIREEGRLSGFVGAEANAKIKNGTVLGVQRMGRGDIVYFADNPLFRGFWYNGRLLMANAVFMR